MKQWMSLAQRNTRHLSTDHLALDRPASERSAKETAPFGSLQRDLNKPGSILPIAVAVP
jgi:hypothetical protein